MDSQNSEKFQKEKELCLAIRENDRIRVNTLLKHKADPQARIDYWNYQMPWFWVYSCDDFLIIRSLLEAGADPNLSLKEIYDRTVIFGQVRNGSESEIRLLISYGADINWVDTRGLTPLYYLTTLGDVSLDLMPTLLELGAKITIKDKQYYDELKNNPEMQKNFEYHISNYLMKFEKAHDLDFLIANWEITYDFDRLETFTAEILELSEELEFSKDVIDRAMKIRQKYCFNIPFVDENYQDKFQQDFQED